MDVLLVGSFAPVKRQRILADCYEEFNDVMVYDIEYDTMKLCCFRTLLSQYPQAFVIISSRFRFDLSGLDTYEIIRTIQAAESKASMTLLSLDD